MNQENQQTLQELENNYREAYKAWLDAKAVMSPIITIDWCDDTLTKKLPWDESQYVTVKRMSDAQRLKRDSMMAKFSNNGDSQSIQMQYDVVKAFEYEHSIIDFRFIDNRKNELKYDARQLPRNRAIYDHVGRELSELIDSMIDEVNGGGKVDEMLGNSAGSSDDTQIPVSTEMEVEAGASILN